MDNIYGKINAMSKLLKTKDDIETQNQFLKKLETVVTHDDILDIINEELEIEEIEENQDC